MSDPATMRAALRALGPLRDFADGELDTLVAVAPARAFGDGDLLCRECEIGLSCFVIVSGEVEVVKAFAGGQRPLATLRAGAVVGQMALCDRGKRSASARAKGPVRALELSREIFEQLLRSLSPLALRFQEQIAVAGIRQLRTATERLALLLGERASGSGPPPASSRPSLAPTPSVRAGGLADVQGAAGEWSVCLDEIEFVPQPKRQRLSRY